MKKAELVFIPSPGTGHLRVAVEMAKLLVERDERLSITVLVMKFPSTKETEPISASTFANRINLIHLPLLGSRSDVPIIHYISSFIESHKPQVKEAVTNLTHRLSASHDSPRLAGFVLDMFCTSMIDIANEFGVPSYVFYTSGAAFLGLLFHVQLLYDEQNKPTTEFKDSDTELQIASLVNPFPVRFLPTLFLFEDLHLLMCDITRRFRTAKGIIVNSYFELESCAFDSFPAGRIGKIPPVYPVGPLLSLKCDTYDAVSEREIMEWLDDQPASSVVFLCFGGRGGFHEDQVKEVARALEESGHRFLWSLRQPPPTGKMAFASDYANPRDVLPEGFLGRTAKIGKIVGWAPQVSVLAHKSIGGFVSHCGWNSTLESIWFGVPMAAWPMYAEQNFNAFQLVRELRLGVEIEMDYKNNHLTGNQMVVSAEEILRGIKKLMEDDGEIRKRTKEMSEKSRAALMNGGSSFSSLGCFIDDVIGDMP